MVKITLNYYAKNFKQARIIINDIKTGAYSKYKPQMSRIKLVKARKNAIVNSPVKRRS